MVINSGFYAQDLNVTIHHKSSWIPWWVGGGRLTTFLVPSTTPKDYHNRPIRAFLDYLQIQAPDSKV